MSFSRTKVSFPEIFVTYLNTIFSMSYCCLPQALANVFPTHFQSNDGYEHLLVFLKDKDSEIGACRLGYDFCYQGAKVRTCRDVSDRHESSMPNVDKPNCLSNENDYINISDMQFSNKFNMDVLSLGR